MCSIEHCQITRINAKYTGFRTITVNISYFLFEFYSICRSDDLLTDKLDYGKIKRDIVNMSISPRERALLLQALRWKLTKAKTDFKREKNLECYIACDLLGCRTDADQRTKIIRQLSSAIGGDTYYVKEEWARLINTVASLRKGKNEEERNKKLIEIV